MKATAARTIGAKGKGHVYIPVGQQLNVGTIMRPSADRRNPAGMEESGKFVVITSGKYAGVVVAREAVQLNGSSSAG